MFFVILLYLLFASVFTTSKVALEYSAPFFLVGSRMLVAGLLLLGYQYFFKKEFHLKKKSFGKLLLLAIFAIYLTNVFEFWGLKYLTSFKTCFIYSLSPFMSALIAYFVLGEVMTPKKWLGFLIGIAGFLPILLSTTHQEEQAGHFWFFSWAELSVMIAVICSVYGWILLKQLVTEEGTPPIMANGIAMLFGGLFALLHSFFVETWNPLPVTEYEPFILSAALLILISNLICYNLYGYLLKRFSATFISFAGLTTPLFTALFGWLFLGEAITLPFYLSFAIVFAGLLLFYQEEFKKKEFRKEFVLNE